MKGNTKTSAIVIMGSECNFVGSRLNFLSDALISIFNFNGIRTFTSWISLCSPNTGFPLMTSRTCPMEREFASIFRDEWMDLIRLFFHKHTSLTSVLSCVFSSTIILRDGRNCKCKTRRRSRSDGASAGKKTFTNISPQVIIPPGNEVLPWET